MNLSSLIETLHFYKTSQPINQLEVYGIEMDSRKVSANDLFVCIEGFTVDGHDFAKQAEEKGACAIVAQRPLDVTIPVIQVRDTSKALAKLADQYYQHPTQKLHLIGVTGTNGKTTTSYLIDSIFQKFKHRTGLIGTLQMKIDQEVFEVKNTTPDALFLQKSFSNMVKQQVDTAVMEVSSHALDIGRIHGSDFDIAVYTNLTQDHLDYHKSMEDYLRAKSLLFAQLGGAYQEQRPKFAVVNVDDPYHQTIVQSTSQEVLTYGIDHEASVTVRHLNLSANGTSFQLVTPVGTITIESNLIGKFSVYNMLAAAGAAIASKVPLNTIKDALEQTMGVSGRFEPVLAGQSYGVIVDYAHTPDSLENVLQTIQSFAEKNVVVVVGCGGDRDKQKRPLMAQIAVKYADKAIFTSDNPRSEQPLSIIHDMEAGVDVDSYQVLVDRKEAIHYAIDSAQEGDIILIAGKGHETYQQIGDEIIHFDDHQVAKQKIMEKEQRRLTE